MKLKAHYHLPGLFEHYEFYKAFLPLYKEHREYFYEWCDIGSVYGAPPDILWAGGRTENGDATKEDVLDLMEKYGIPVRLTLSNSLLGKEHLSDPICNELCSFFSKSKVPCGIIIHSDVLLSYLKVKYPDFYFISSTTKVLSDFRDFRNELDKPDFHYVVPDFRLNKDMNHLSSLTEEQKNKTEFLCNECCIVSCRMRKLCYENVSRIILGEDVRNYVCQAEGGKEGYRFSRAMENPSFIGYADIRDTYLPMGFSNFKLEGRGLGSAVLLEFILHYMVKPECQLKVREALYLDSMLDLF